MAALVTYLPQANPKNKIPYTKLNSITENRKKQKNKKRFQRKVGGLIVAGSLFFLFFLFFFGFFGFCVFLVVLLLAPPVYRGGFTLKMFSPLLPVSPSHCRGMKPALLLATFTLSWPLHSFTLTGGSSGPSGDVLRHGLQILVPKSDALLHPEAVTVRVHRVEGNFFLPNPCIEDFRHIGADLGQSFLFISCEFFLGAFVGE